MQHAICIQNLTAYQPLNIINIISATMQLRTKLPQAHHQKVEIAQSFNPTLLAKNHIMYLF